MSDCVRPYGQQPISLLCPQDSLGKNTGVGCHFLLQTKGEENIYFPSAHGTFSMIGHMLEHETTLSIINKIEILLSNISDHNIMKVEINCKLKVKKKKNGG